MRRFLWLALLLAAPAFASTTFSVNVKSLSQGAPAGTTVKLELRNCSGIPRVIGTGALAPQAQTFTPDGTGLVTASIWANNEIDCAGAQTSYYNVSLLSYGQSSSWGSIQTFSGSAANLNSISTCIVGGTVSCLLVQTPAGPMQQGTQGPPGTLTATSGLNGQIFFTSQRVEASVGARICGAYDAAPAYGGTIWADEFTGGQVSSDCFSSRTGKQIHLILGNGLYAFAASTTFPSNWLVQLLQGAQLCPANSTTLTLTQAPLATQTQQIVCSAALGNATFNFAGPVSIGWFGAVGDGATDNQPMIQAAIAATEAVQPPGGASNPVLCPSGLYAHRKPLLIQKNNDGLVGPETAAGACQLQPFFYGPAVAIGPGTSTAYTAFSTALGTSLATGAGNAFVLSPTYYLNLKDVQQGVINGLAQFDLEFYANLSSAPDNAFLVDSEGRLNNSDSDRSSLGSVALWMLSGNWKATLITSGSGRKTFAGPAVTLNTTHFIELCYDGSNGRLFIDGVMADKQAMTGTIAQAVREDFLVGSGTTAFPENASGVAAGSVDSIRISNSCRHPSDSPYTPPTAKLANDGNTLLLLNFDNQYNIFTGAAVGTPRSDLTAWLPIHRSLGGSALISAVTLRNIDINGKNLGEGMWAYGLTGAQIINYSASFVRRGLTLWGGGTFENDIWAPQINVNSPNGEYGIFTAACACGISHIYGGVINGAPSFPIYWANGSVTLLNVATAPNQGVISDFYFDGSSTNNMTVTMVDGGADDEVPNTSYFSVLTLVGVQNFNMVGGNLGAASHAVAPVRVKGGGSINFTGTNFLLGGGTPSVITVVSNPAQPINLTNPIQQGGTNVPWVDVADQGTVTNNPITNTTNLKAAQNKDGSFYLSGVTFANLGTPANGTFQFCRDCAVANPCVGAGTGAFATRRNGVWVCN